MIIFQIRSKLNPVIRLTERQWNHITTKHAEITLKLKEIKSLLTEPDRVYEVPVRQNYHYYKYYSTTPVTYGKYLCIVVKHLNLEGFIITCYYTSKIKEKGKVLTYEKELAD